MERLCAIHTLLSLFTRIIRLRFPKGNENSAAAQLAACLERWDEAMNSPTPPEAEALRAFCLEIMDKGRITGGRGEPFTSLKDVLGTTLGKWRDAQPKAHLVGGPFFR